MKVGGALHRGAGPEGAVPDRVVVILELEVPSGDAIGDADRTDRYTVRVAEDDAVKGARDDVRVLRQLVDEGLQRAVVVDEGERARETCQNLVRSTEWMMKPTPFGGGGRGSGMGRMRESSRPGSEITGEDGQNGSHTCDWESGPRTPR